MAITSERAAGSAPPAEGANGPRADAQAEASTLTPARRRTDTIGRYTRPPAKTKSRKSAGRLRNEIVIPCGIGAAALAGSLGIVAAATTRVGGPTVMVSSIAAFILIAALMAYVAWIVEGAALKPLARVRRAFRAMEEGKYETRLEPTGARELAELADDFNQMAQIVGEQRDRLELAATKDGLTDLANYRRFHEQLHRQLDAARRQDEPLSVAALDLDGFRKINETYGNAHGDMALRDVADALRKVVREDDVVARFGGDDFMVLIPGADAAQAREVADRLRDAAIRALAEENELTASAGFACFPEGSAEGSNLAELAAAALDVAKRGGGNQTRKYDPEQAAARPTLKQQRAEIDQLLQQEEPIITVFQPLVDLVSGRTVAYEALSRFNSDTARSPADWFSQAQDCGRGLRLEMEAIRAALSAQGRPAGSYLSLNVSPSAIASTKILSVLPEDMSDILIEVTEHELAAEDGALEEGIKRLRARGARIAVDDAGAGYAGLKQLTRVQPDVIKLDRALVESIQHDGVKAAAVEFFVSFARRVGAGICTEGIETLDELRAVLDLGVNYGQGYLLGRPQEPWEPATPEISRALATGALRSHPIRPGGEPSAPPSRAPDPTRTGPTDAQGASVHWLTPDEEPEQAVRGPSGPVNRRLKRH